MTPSEIFWGIVTLIGAVCIAAMAIAAISDIIITFIKNRNPPKPEIKAARPEELECGNGFPTYYFCGHCGNGVGTKDKGNWTFGPTDYCSDCGAYIDWDHIKKGDEELEYCRNQILNRDVHNGGSGREGAENSPAADQNSGTRTS